MPEYAGYVLPDPRADGLCATCGKSKAVVNDVFCLDCGSLFWKDKKLPRVEERTKFRPRQSPFDADERSQAWRIYKGFSINRLTEIAEGSWHTGQPLRNLILELGQRGEFAFRAQRLHEGHLKLPAIQVALVIKDVSFGTQRWLGLFQCRTEADVDDGEMGDLLNFHPGHIDPTRREDQTGYVQVSRRESELGANSVAPGDQAGDGIGSPQHLASPVQIARGNGIPNAGAADGLAIQRDSGRSVHLEPQLLPQPF